MNTRHLYCILLGIFTLVATICFSMLTSTALGAGGGLDSSSLSNSFDFGDIYGGYNTHVYPYSDGARASMSLYISGEHEINSCEASFYPEYRYIYDDQGNLESKDIYGYRVSASIRGKISGQLSDDDIGHLQQDNHIDARGIGIDEYTSISVYNADWDGLLHLRSDASARVSIQNFDVRYASANYNEYTYEDSGEMVTNFGYYATWYGDFLPGTVAPGFIMPALSVSVEPSPVPEPSTVALLITALASAGFGILRRLWV